MTQYNYLRRLESYFSGPAEFEPLLHTWPLSVEEQYYLIWPALLLVAWRLGTRFGQPRRAILLLLALTLAGSMLTCWIWAGWRNPWAFYLLPARAWELAAGGALALVVAGGVERRKWLGAATSLTGVAVVAAAMIVAPPAEWFPAPAAAVPVLGTLAIILGNAWNPGGPVARALGLRPLVAIGLVSYAWYLWHWPALSLVRIAMLGEPDLARDCLVSGLTLALSFATLTWYENPIRHGRMTSHARVLGGAWASACLLMSAAGATIWWVGIAQPTAAERHLLAAKGDTPTTQRKCHVGLGAAGSDRLGDCLAGGREPRVLLWGDSYADHWSPALYAWAERQPQVPAIEHLTKDACPPLPGVSPTETRVGLWKPYAGCRAFNDQVAERLRIAAASGRATVVMSAAWWFRATDQDLTHGGAFLEPSHSFDVGARGEAASRAVLAERLRHTLTGLRDQGLRTVIILQSPQLLKANGQRLRAPECLFRQSEPYCAIPEALHRSRVALVHRTIAEVAAKFDSVRLFDPAPSLCDDGLCRARISGTVAYTDDGHISASMSVQMLDRLGPLLDWAARTVPAAATGRLGDASMAAPGGGGYLGWRLSR